MSYQRVSKKEAFETLPNEVQIPMDLAAHDFIFTRNWFKHRNLTTFSTFLAPKYTGEKPVRSIQIGCFEAQDVVWQLQNLHKAPGSSMTIIDPWEVTTKISANEMGEVETHARHNLLPYRQQVHIHKGYSQTILSEAVFSKQGIDGIPPGHFDYAIIDGDHNKLPAYEDAVYCLDMVKVGGWLVFDDVENRIEKKEHVKQAVDMFLNHYGWRVKFVWKHRFCECFERVA